MMRVSDLVLAGGLLIFTNVDDLPSRERCRTRFCTRTAGHGGDHDRAMGYIDWPVT